MELRLATLGDLVGHLAAKGAPLPRGEYQLMVSECLAERVVAAHIRADAPEVLGGLYQPDVGGPGTCWFSVVPGAVSRDLAPLALAMRGIVVRSAPAFPEGLAAYVRDGNGEGQRLATALGFRPTGVLVGDLRRWLYVGRTYRPDRAAPVPTGARGAGAAAGGSRRAGA